MSPSSAHHVFDKMSIQPEATSSCILHITITNLIYEVTEDVLDQLFDAYGVHDLCVSHKSTHMEVFVEFQSCLEASEAKGALHGRCIYDGCCLLDIQHAPPSISVITLPSSKPVVVDFDCLEMAPPALVQATLKGASSPMPSSNAEGVKPTMPSTPAKSEEQSTLVVLAMHTPRCQEKVQQDTVEVFETGLEVAGSGMKPGDLMKWVSRVPTLHRRVQWTLRSKFRNSATTPPPPPTPPHPPDQPVHYLDPCPPPQPPSPPHPPDQLSVMGFPATTMMIVCHTAHVTHLSFEQQKYGQVHGHSYMLVVTQSWRRSAFSPGYIVLWDDFISDLVLTYVRGMSLFPEEGLGSADELFPVVLHEDTTQPYEVLTHVGGLSLFLEFWWECLVAAASEEWHDKSTSICSAFSPGNIVQQSGWCTSSEYIPTVTRLQERCVCQLALNEDSIHIMNILDELQISSSWITSSTEHLYIVVNLLSRSVSSAPHFLDSSLEEVTISAARLWDPGIF
jgi:hypothetical protein